MKLSAEQKKLFDALTERQRAFAIRVLAGDEGAEAYRKAGYNGKTPEVQYSGASEILRKPKVKAFIDSVRESQVSDAIATREEALASLTAMARTASDNMALLALTEDDNKPDAHQIKLKELAIKAYKQIGDWQGWDAPKKQELDLSNSDKSLAPQTLDASKLSTAALRELAKAMNDTDSEADEG